VVPFKHKNYLGTYLVIGEAKCGTSSLYKYLIQHPNITPARCKELHYFDKVDNINPSRYFSLLSSNTNLTIPFMLGEATPAYFRVKRSPDIPKTIKNTIPGVHLILLVRNPIDRMYSNYWHHVRKHGEKRPFEKAMYSWFKNPISDYSGNLKRWLRYFNLNQMFIIKSADFFNNIQNGYQRLCTFLGLSVVNLNDVSPVIPTAPKEAIPTKHYPKMKRSTREILRNMFVDQMQEFHDLTGISWDEFV